MFEGFKKFILRGNVMDLAVGVIIGAAFTAIVNSLVKDIITPFLGIFGGVPDFSALTFAINGSQFGIGSFINAVLSFLIVASVLYFFVITPVNRLMEMRKVEEAPAQKTIECPECLSKIPSNARRCAFCTTVLVPDALTAGVDAATGTVQPAVAVPPGTASRGAGGG